MADPPLAVSKVSRRRRGLRTISASMWLAVASTQLVSAGRRHRCCCLRDDAGGELLDHPLSSMTRATEGQQLPDPGLANSNSTTARGASHKGSHWQLPSRFTNKACLNVAVIPHRRNLSLSETFTCLLSAPCRSSLPASASTTRLDSSLSKLTFSLCSGRVLRIRL